MKKITIIIEDDCEVKVVTEEYIEKETRPDVTDYARFFNEMCPTWTTNPEYNLMFLKTQERHATDKLRANGYLFLNDVYDMLGMPRTKAGQVVGWIYDENNPYGDNYIDFNIYAEHNANFVNGYERTALLDFNVDGNILDRI